MANDAPQNLRAFLLASATIAELVGDRIHQVKVPSDRTRRYVWLQQTGIRASECLDDAPGTPPEAYLFAVECCARTLAEAIELATAVRNLTPFAGSFGDTTCKALLAQDHSEDYYPINAQTDGSLYVEALQLELLP